MMHTGRIMPEEVAPPAAAPAVRLNPLVFAGAGILRLAATGDSLPVAETQTGNVFRDRVASDVAWYLPEFALRASPDGAFGFKAVQAGVDANGSPFNRAGITFGLTKRVPDDVRAYQAKNPTIQLHEIPLNGLAAVLSTTANDPATGNVQTGTSPGTIVTGADGSISVAFQAVVGTAVIVAYENLQLGGASIALTASYNVWHEQSTSAGVWWHPIDRMPMAPLARTAMLEPSTALARPAQPAVEGTAAFRATLQLGTTYEAGAYTSAFTVSDSSGTRVIVNVDDLTSFQTAQSEFREFTELGDISLKYPSFSRLYIGQVSRTIVAVPARYGIVRGSTGTAAVCQALLDSTAGSTQSCTFQFAFLLGPVVSPIELAQLAQDVSANQASKDCSVVLPTQVDGRSSGTLATPFQTSVSYLAGAQPQTFSLTVDIAGAGGSGTPAVASANLFIAQLTATVEPFLVGQFAIALDDAYHPAVEVEAVLNFSLTSGSDEIGLSVDPASGDFVLKNNSPLDLSVSRYATISNGQIDIAAIGQTLPAGQSLALGASGTLPVGSVFVERSLALETPLTKAGAARYLDFQLQDVQAVQYEIGVVAAGVNFAARGIASIAVAVTLTALPQLDVPSFTLSALDQAGNEQIQLPIQYALSTLAATLRLTVQPLDGTQAPVQFTLGNDFIAQPVLVLADSNIPGFPALPAAATP